MFFDGLLEPPRLFRASVGGTFVFLLWPVMAALMEEMTGPFLPNSVRTAGRDRNVVNSKVNIGGAHFLEAIQTKRR